MPVPPLPIEIVRAILSFVDFDTLAEHRKFGGHVVALVCKTWRPLGAELGLKKLVLIAGETDKLVETLLERTEALQHTKVLPFSPRCEHLVRLSFGPSFVVDFLQAASTSPSAPKLILLAATIPFIVPISHLNPGLFARRLFSFSRLETLDLRVANFGDEIDYANVMREVGVDKLGLAVWVLNIDSMGQPAFSAYICRLFTRLIDPNTLKNLLLSVEKFGDLDPSAIPHSPISLAVFVASFPPELQQAAVFGVLFPIERREYPAWTQLGSVEVRILYFGGYMAGEEEQELPLYPRALLRIYDEETDRYIWYRSRDDSKDKQAARAALDQEVWTDEEE
ncbi:hypothetical protein JCM8547_005901 [Rhodosporidiobolus lusitaniae]